MSTLSPIVDKIMWRCRDAVLSRPPLPASGAAGPVTVAGLFRTASGIGQSARACADGLEYAGVPVHRVDLSAAFGQLELPPDPRLLDKAPAGGTLIVHFNAPEIERALFLLGNWRGSQRRVIGMWVWEMPTTPPDWHPATRWLSEIWVPSRFAYEALRPLTDKPMKVVPYFISGAPPSQVEPSGDIFKVIAFGDGKSSFARKNLLSALRAFQDAALEVPSQLILKTRNINCSPAVRRALEAARDDDPRIRILDASLEREDVMALIGSSDVLVSLHRSEGFGLTIAEAMLRGKPVIATGWSGNTDFMDADCAVPVPYRLVPVDDTYGVYRTLPGAVWAEPDVGFASSAIHRLANDPAERARLGAEARKRIAPLTTGLAYKEALADSVEASD